MAERSGFANRISRKRPKYLSVGALEKNASELLSLQQVTNFCFRLLVQALQD